MPTGYGKSLCYQFQPVYQERRCGYQEKVVEVKVKKSGIFILSQGRAMITDMLPRLAPILLFSDVPEIETDLLKFEILSHKVENIINQMKD